MIDGPRHAFDVGPQGFPVRRLDRHQAPETPDAAPRPGRPRRGERRAEAAAELAGEALDLFDALRAWRRGEAARQGLPPYVIFHDQTLVDIAKARPRTRADLSAINGVGQGKLDRYGEAVLDAVEAAQR